jgi:hypothetical protein
MVRVWGQYQNTVKSSGPHYAEKQPSDGTRSNLAGSIIYPYVMEGLFIEIVTYR